MTVNLVWLAAVLEPNDVVVGESSDRGGPAHMAAVVLGRYVPREDGDLANDLDDPAGLVQRCLVADTITTGISRISSLLSEGAPSDAALAAALALVACTAAVELDDYKTCLEILDRALRRKIVGLRSDRALVRAALLQQRALRLRDFGRPYLASSDEAASTLSQVDVAACSEFATAPHVPWSSTTTLTRMRDNLMSAIASIVPVEGDLDYPAANKLVHESRGIRTESDLERRTAAQRAATYSAYVNQVFKDEFGATEAIVIGGGSTPDLFHSTLSLELFGHGAVYRARKELALLRLVQAENDPVQLADALRLMRHAGAKAELDLALRRLRDAGPLAVLSRDARQILRTRTSPELLRSVELQVLRISAELLAPAEARLALDAVIASLAAGGPPNLPGTWQLPVSRKEVAWRAAAALANSCGATGEVAQLLLDETSNPTDDAEILDRAVNHALLDLDWDAVPTDSVAAWTRRMDILATTFPSTAGQVRRLVGVAPSDDAVESTAHLVDRLNFALRGKRPFTPLPADIAMLEEALRTIREEAARKHYSFGGLEPADMAAGMLTLGVDSGIWREVADFLLDLNVQRNDRTAAFERLSRAEVTIPVDIYQKFRDQARSLLYVTDDNWDQDPIIPYPAALRFLAAHSLLSQADTYDAIAALAGRGKRGRREAAISIAVLSAKQAHPALLALALSLARDDNIDVRANAGRALALLANRSEQLASVATSRIAELLGEDGLLSPITMLRSLRDAPEGLRDHLRPQVEELAKVHPSRRVRKEAMELAGQR